MYDVQFILVTAQDPGTWDPMVHICPPPLVLSPSTSAQAPTLCTCSAPSAEGLASDFTEKTELAHKLSTQTHEQQVRPSPTFSPF